MTPAAQLDQSDLHLLSRWDVGDPGAGNALVLRYRDSLHRFLRFKCPPDEIEDILQQVWEAVTLSCVRSPSDERGPRSIRTTIRAYLFGITRRVLCSHYRRRQHHPAADPLTTSLRALDPSLSERLALNERAHHLAHALQQLPLDLQFLMELRYTEELSTAELSAIFEIPTGTVKTRLMRGRQLLAEVLRTP